MAAPLAPRDGNDWFEDLSDERLAALVRAGDVAAFEALYRRHHAALLAFCRRMVAHREDGEDALQQTFARAHRALRHRRAPDAVRPWLFAIARNRCLTVLAARRGPEMPVDEHASGIDVLDDEVIRRANLGQLLADLARLPESQRRALTLFELGGLSHVEIASAIGCSAAKIKALVFQARAALVAERAARETPCAQIRGQLDVARGPALRGGLLRRHLFHCEPCHDYRLALPARRSQTAGSALLGP